MIWAAIWSWLRSLPPAARWGAAVIAALALGYTFGRWAQPAKVVTKTETRTEVKYQDRIVYKEAKARVVYRNVVRTVTVDRQPSGEIKTTTTITDKSRDQTDTETSTKQVASSEATGITLASKTVTSKATSSFGVLVGVGVYAPDGVFKSTLTPSRPPLGPAWLGARYEHSVAGPLFLGGWALTNGRDVLAGASLSLSF